MTTLMVTHDVTDFDTWRAAFEAGADVRRRHGATSSRILVEGTSVVGLIDFPDDDAAQAFLADPALTRPIPGVPGRPSLRVLHDLDPVLQ